MKSLKNILLAIILFPAFLSCVKMSGDKVVFETKEIHFPIEGGSRIVRIIKGNFDVMQIYLDIWDDMEERDNYVRRGWAEMERIDSEGSISLRITLSPNESGAPRSVHMGVYSGDRGGIITVYQE